MNVTIEWAGRLGNNMFQAATVLAYAYKHQVTPVFLEHEYFKLAKNKMTIQSIYEEPCHAYREIPYLDNVLLKGYFQSEKYFKDIKELLRKYFVRIEYPVLNEYIAIHVRRGDYLLYPDKHPQPDLANYYYQMMSTLSPSKYLIFSDGGEWCKKQFEHIPDVFYSWEMCPDLNDYEYLQLMASCGGHIIGNSSFSWWGAWLSKSENVICPSYDNWFGEGNKHLYPNDIIPENWTQIKY